MTFDKATAPVQLAWSAMLRSAGHGLLPRRMVSKGGDRTRATAAAAAAAAASATLGGPSQHGSLRPAKKNVSLKICTASKGVGQQPSSTMSRQFLTPRWRYNARLVTATSTASASIMQQQQPFSVTAVVKGKGRQQDNNSGPDASGQDADAAIALLEALMAKRALLVARRTESMASGDAATAKELADLDGLQGLWEEWQGLQRSVEGVLRMTTPEAEPDEAMRALALEEAETTLASLDTLRRSIRRALGPVDDVDEQDAIIEVRMGVGGGESTLFVAEIARMYMRFCEKGIGSVGQSEGAREGSGAEWSDGSRSFDVEELSAVPVDVSTTGGGGSEAYREVILSVKGRGAYGLLRHEAGVHRVQRVPATQNLGKLQTSTIAVIVLPAGGRESSSSSIESARDDVVDPKEVKIEVMRARGAGGQHVNKTESAVRLTHEPTGISVSMQDSRSQHQNRTKAWTILRARLLDRKLRQEAQENRNVRRSQIGTMERHERVRTYNYPQDRITDHRIPLTMKGLDAVLEGEGVSGRGLGFLVEALLEHRDGLALADRREQIEQDLVALRAVAPAAS